jgi:amino acid transporter
VAEAPQTLTPAPDLPETEARYLAEAGRIWSTQTPPEADRRWSRVEPDVEVYQEDEDTGGNTGVIRFARSEAASLQRLDDQLLRVTSRVERPAGGLSRLAADARKLLLGEPLASHRLIQERLTKIKALAVLSSDPLSSVAYATEQTLAVLILAGAGALVFAPGLGLAIIILLLVVGLSYRQTIKAYPRGGGSYIVASDNLGHLPGLVAGASLMTDYILTVAVSVSAGVAAITSAYPSLSRLIVPIGLGVIFILMLGNLRGIREAGNIFALPTYLFILGMLALIAAGILHLLTQGSVSPYYHQSNIPDAGRHAFESLAGVGGVFLILKAFASGCTALTGVEAISDGVPAFKPPEWRNARTTLMVMVGIALSMFAGVTFLAHQFGLYPDVICGPELPAPLNCDIRLGAYQTLLSKLAHVVFGSGLGYFYLQATTALILLLAANTSFSDFPRLLYFMARDKYAPSQFGNLGDRLAFSNGIITLGVLAGLLYFIFGGSTDALIPLYTIGVFISFTLSQFGMVVHWRRIGRGQPSEEQRGWRRKMAMNLTGAIMTSAVFVIAAYTKFVYGAWVVVVLIPILVLIFVGIHRHYESARRRVQAETPLSPGRVRPVAVVPIGDLTDIQLQALALARRLADRVVAVYISDDPEKIKSIRRKWEIWGNHVPLEVIESPYRSLVRPLLNYLDAVEAQNRGSTLMVILPELVYSRWWHQFLHNQNALRLKAALLFRPGTVVVNVPYHLREERVATAARTAE